MKIFGLIGKNISYSFSPILHKKIASFYNFPLYYTTFDINNIDEFNIFFQNLKANSISGLNITIPYKKEVFKFVDFVSEETEEIKASNCLKILSNRIEAYNTDYFGVIKTFEKMKLELKNKEVYILGTGGASLAVAKALKDLDAKFFFVSRNIYDKKDFPFANKLIDYNELENRKGYLLINATPIGTTPNTNISPVSKQTIENFNILFDLIYNPRETLFLRWGKELGKQVENGLYMLVAQAVKSQEIWFDKKLDYNKIYELIQEEL